MGGQPIGTGYNPRMPTYRGACHCKAVQFEVDADIDHVRVCDCSVCSMRGGLMFRVPEGGMRLLTPMENLTAYRWGSRTAVDYFCPICGILPFRKPSALTQAERLAGMSSFEGWAINTRCLEGFSPNVVSVVKVFGRQLDIESG